MAGRLDGNASDMEGGFKEPSVRVVHHAQNRREVGQAALINITIYIIVGLCRTLLALFLLESLRLTL